VSRSWLLTVPLAVIALALGAGALLVATGRTVLGIVVCALALLRLAVLVSLALRVRHVRAAARRADGDEPVLRSLAQGQFEVAAGAIGTSPSEVRIDFAKGRSIAEIAAAHDVPVGHVVDAVVADAAAKLDRAVADGRTSPTAAERFKARLPRWATRLVHGHRGELRRTRAGTFG
jgi:hypothetical protein